MATNTKQQNLLKAKTQLDTKYGNWAWDYVEKMLKSWKTLDDVKKELSSWTFKSYTPYTPLTNKTPTKNTNPGWTPSDLSYVKSTDYYSSWEPWDYKANIAKDPDRAKQMAYNLKADMKTNPKLFRNRADFDKYYRYSDRDPSQQKMLDEFFDNANKYWLWATDNFYADMASEASTDKNKKLLAKAADTYNKMLPAIDWIKDKLNDRLGPVFDKLMDSQTKYLQDMAYLRKLQMQYNKGMVEEANSRAAGQSASLWTMMSWQWLSQSAIASSMFWAEKAWVSELNNIQEQHIRTMKELADAEWDFTNNRAGIVNNLTSTEQNYLKNWYDAFKWLQDWLDDAYKTMITEKYNPYEILTQAKVAWWAETLTSAWKTDIKQSEYQSADNAKRRSIIYNQLYWLLWSNPELFWKLTPYINAAANNSDWEAAVTEVLSKAWAKPQTITKIVEKLVTPDDTKDTKDTNDTNDEKIDYSSLFSNLPD